MIPAPLGNALSRALRARADGVAPRGSASGANNVVFELRTVRNEIYRGAFRERIIRTQHWNRNVVIASGAWQTDDRGFVHAPALEMWQFKASGDFIGTAWRRTRFGP